MSSARGRDYYPTKPVSPLKPSEVVPSATYIERGQRWMEKEEAYSLRDAMEEMDLRNVPDSPTKATTKSPKKSLDATPNETSDDEARLHDAALNEAAELVWQHQNPDKVPRPDGPYRYRPHLRKDSYAHARTASAGRYGDDIAASGMARDRSVSGSSTEDDGCSRRSRPSMDSTTSKETTRQNRKSYGSIGSNRRSSMKRNISGEIERPFSGDQIWEEPESTSPSKPEVVSTRKPHNHVRFQSSRDEVSPLRPLNRVEIHRNPPTRSRNAAYTVNTDAPTPPADETVEKNNGIEIRSQDIRAATSFTLKDRSPRLPEPTAVSDSPGRPIVSFDANWRAPEESTDTNPDHQEPTPRVLKQPMDVPEVAVAEDTPSRAWKKADANVPSISVGADDGSSARPLPTINVPTIAVEPSRPLPTINLPNIAVDDSSPSSVPVIVTPNHQPAKTPRALPTPGQRPRAQRPRGHWSPAPGTVGRPTALCHECGFPIEGRFVSLAGSSERFHPQCLSCFICATSLEAMEISQEPQDVRAQRISRIHARAQGESVPEEPGMTEAEDGDERLRFFCHLDWHELFAPKCKHCKTAILGDHIVALGAHWHYGHFFCAECGDPFEQGMTHIEKDGYAWCVKCQTKRTERRAPKCKKCNTAVIGEYIQALGGEWHEACFRCGTCKGGFEDGQIFPVEKDGRWMVVCTGCRERELKR